MMKDPLREQRIYRARLLFVMLMMVLMLAALMARYFSLQILEHQSYSTQSDRNRIQLQPVAPKRGLIFDRNGELLADNVPSYAVTVVVERTENLDKTLAEIGELIAISDDDLRKFKRRSKRRRPYEAVPLRFRLSEEDVAQLAVNRHRLPGVEIDAQLQRRYFHGELFAHVLGYVGRISESEMNNIDEVNYRATNHIGKIGLEKHYEALLHGSVGYQNVETNARGRVLRVLERVDPLPGRDIELNVDIELQRVAYESLGDERGAVVALDLRDGGVLAMASAPSYDANQFVEGISTKDYAVLRSSKDLPLFNRALQGRYPPGSTVKPFMAMAGLHYNVVTPQSTVYDPGWYSLPNDEHRYRDWKKTGHGHAVNLHESIVESCDTYYYHLAFNLGIDRIHEFGAGFGLGQLTGIDTTSESQGLLPSRTWKRATKGLHWYPGETINVGIGQGYMLATPLQLALQTAVLAGRGKSYTPRLLKAVGGDVQPALGRERVIADENHWSVVIEAMKAVVHGSKGTARHLSEGLMYTMAGKTGTAQVVGIAAGEEYDSEQLAKRNRDHALFVAFAPIEDPQIAVAVIVENGESGSRAAAPVARKVIDNWLLRDTVLSSTRDQVAGSN